MALPLIYQTPTMLAAVEEMPPAATFLKDRYFPTNPGSDIFGTPKVLMDIRDGQQKMAPVVLPRKKGITVLREAYRTMEMEAPFIAPQRPLTLDDLHHRGFGEALFPTSTPEQRAAAILGQDLVDMDRMITNREEYIAARCMLDNGYVLPQYADEYGTVNSVPYEIHFYSDDNNPSRYTPATPWNQAGANIYGDLTAMVRMLTAKGKPVSDLVASPDVIDAIVADETIAKMLDNRRMNMGMIDPTTLPEGASYYGNINISGRIIGLYSYDVQFTDDQTGESTPVIKPGEMVLTAPDAGRGLYGAIDQLETDGEFHTYAATRVPKYMPNVDADVRTVRLAARPLLVPRTANPWVSANVFA